MDADARWQLIAGLVARLAGAVGAHELIAATRPPEGVGVIRSLEPDSLWVGTDRLPSAVPRVVLDVDPPLDARSMCRAWGIVRPVAVSGDVHQSRWQIEVAGEDLPDPFGRRIATRPISAGRWVVRAWLTGRPVGDLPGVTAGASPAYDVAERGGDIRRIEISPVPRRSAIVAARHPDAQALLDLTAASHAARRAGWRAAPEADFALIYDGEQPVAGAAVRDEGDGTFLAWCLCVARDLHADGAGSDLLDVLEAVVLHRGGTRLALDGSSFLDLSAVPHLRYGYVVTPPHDGDADATASAERELRPPPA